MLLLWVCDLMKPFKNSMDEILMLHGKFTVWIHKVSTQQSVFPTDTVRHIMAEHINDCTQHLKTYEYTGNILPCDWNTGNTLTPVLTPKLWQ